MTPSSEFVAHLGPVWRDRSDFILRAELTKGDLPKRFEQLFARRLSDDRFEISCIPFFLYDIALGDVVYAAPEGERQYVVDRVVESSGRYVFRVYFGKSFHPREEIAQELEELGAQLEWSSRNLLAIDAADHEHAQRVADFLAEREAAGHLMYETGARERLARMPGTASTVERGMSVTHRGLRPRFRRRLPTATYQCRPSVTRPVTICRRVVAIHTIG